MSVLSTASLTSLNRRTDRISRTGQNTRSFELPTEILSWIFTIACSPRSPFDHAIRPIRHSIESTCSLWRETALITPALWSYIPIEFYGGLKPGVMPPFPLLSLELERSKAMPLRISIQTQPSIAMDTYDHMRILTPYVQQCRSIVIFDEVRSSDWAEQLMGRRGRPHSYPNLRSLCWIGPSRANQTTWVDLSQAPLLEELTLQNVQPRRNVMGWNQSSMDDPFGQMSIGVQGFATNLRSLHWHIQPYDAMRLTLVPNLQLEFPKLLYLGIGTPKMSDGVQYGEYTKLLHLISAPLLEYLESSSFPPSPLQGQFPALTTLRFNGFVFNHNQAENIQEILRSFANLNSTLKHIIFPALRPIPLHYLKALAGRDGSKSFTLLPHLESVTVYLVPSTDMFEAIEELVEARNHLASHNRAREVEQPFVVIFTQRYMNLRDKDLQKRHPSFIMFHEPRDSHRFVGIRNGGSDYS